MCSAHVLMRFCHRVNRSFVCKAKEGRYVRIRKTIYLDQKLYEEEFEDSKGIIRIRKSFVLSLFLITGFVTRLTRRVPLVEQKLLTLPEHLRSSRFLAFSGIRVASKAYKITVYCLLKWLVWVVKLFTHQTSFYSILVNLGNWKEEF
jgi:hypothetical protein